MFLNSVSRSEGEQHLEIPVSDWMKNPLPDWAEHLLNETRLREQGLLSPKAVHRIWQQHLSGWQDHDSLLWSLLMFQGWKEESLQCLTYQTDE